MKTFVDVAALAVLGLASLTSAAYTLSDNMVASNFFSQFNFFTGNDPTHGFVNYVDQGTAQNQGLINTNNNRIYMGVDYQTMNPGGRGRNSIRLESRKQYTHGLFILDLNHMPGSICGAWPAFWTYGPNWPSSGEIDILEGVNSQNVNFVTLHTGGVCQATNGGFNGQLTSNDCAVSTGGGAGCSIHSWDGSSYGTGLNNIGGGVYAMEWLSSGIKIWFFGRNTGIPGDISSGNPNPSSWGTPMASFPSNNNCNVDGNFANHWVVFDTTFCGDWAGDATVWNNDPTCRSQASSCQAFVASNPGAFQQAYWDINSLKVYQSNGQFDVASASNSPKSSQSIRSTKATAVPTTISTRTISSPQIPIVTTTKPVYATTSTAADVTTSARTSKAASATTSTIMTTTTARTSKHPWNRSDSQTRAPLELNVANNDSGRAGWHNNNQRWNHGKRHVHVHGRRAEQNS